MTSDRRQLAQNETQEHDEALTMSTFFTASVTGHRLPRIVVETPKDRAS